MIKLNKIILSSFFFLLFWLLPKTIVAQSPTLSSEEESEEMEVVIDGEDMGEATSTSTEAIKELILKKVAEQSDSATNLDNLNSWRRAVLGEVEKITDDSISITTKSGIFVIATNSDLSFKKNDKKIEAKNVEIGNWILVVGTTKVSEKKQADLLTSLQPQIIYVYDKSPKPEEPFVEVGTIKSIGYSSITLLSRKSKDEITVNVKQAKYQDSTGETIKLNNLEKDMAILVTGLKEQAAYNASTVVSLVELNLTDEKP